MKETEIQKEKSRRTVRGELALMVAVAVNSLGVVLMLHSGAGISAISSVPYAFSEVFTRVSLGTWTYIFQGLLVLSLMILRKKFVPQYLFSFVVGFAFSELLDVHESWINVLPLTPGYRVIYFLISYILLCIGIALSESDANCRSYRRIYSRENCRISHPLPILRSKLDLMLPALP